MRHPLRFVFVAAAFAFAVSFASTIVAAPVTWERIDVTRHSGEGGGVTLVSGELPASASLPAQAELSVPAGSELQWIGEILGGESSADPALTYTKTTVGGSDVYRFTLTKSRTAQIEVPIPDAQPFDGTTYTSSLAWTATQNVPEVGLNLRVPQSAKIATAVPGAVMQPGDSSYSFYTKTVKNVKAGDQLALAVGYTLPAVAAAAAAGAVPSGGSNSVVPIMLVLLVSAAFLALIVGVRRKMVGSSAADEAAPVRADSRQGTSDRSADADGADSRPISKKSESSPRKPLTGKAKRNLVTAVIIGALTVVAVVVGVQTTRPQGSGDTITQTFAAGEACANASFPLTVSDGADPRKTADALFAAIKPIPGLTNATYNVKTKSIDIGYCESSSSEGVFRAALAPTGMVAAGAAVVPPAQ
jgi:hypothetical protein